MVLCGLLVITTGEGNGTPLQYSCLENPMDGGCSPWGHWGSDTTERLHFHFSLSCIGEGNGNPLPCYCLENPRDGGAWWAAVYGVAQSRTRLKRLSSSSSSEHHFPMGTLGVELCKVIITWLMPSFFLAMLHGMQDLISLTRDWMQELCSGTMES